VALKHKKSINQSTARIWDEQIIHQRLVSDFIVFQNQNDFVGKIIELVISKYKRWFCFIGV